MNMLLYFRYGNSERAGFDTRYEPGRSWSVSIDLLF
jgi:hypothetical protein